MPKRILSPLYDVARSHLEEYVIWKNIRRRCRCVTHSDFHRYGAKGRTMCDLFYNSFDDFLKEVGMRPSEAHSIERKDNKLGYVEGNIKWATPAEQNRNKSNNIWVTMDGQTKILQDWCDEYGIGRSTVQNRIDRGGWTAEDAIKTPHIEKLIYTNINGETKSRQQWCEIFGIDIATVKKRRTSGWDEVRALTTPSRRKAS